MRPRPKNQPKELTMDQEHSSTYGDRSLSCDNEALTIRYYYPWGSKRIPYSAIRGVQRLPLTGVNKVRRWRIWGSGDFLHWWNLDTQRPHKDVALVLDLGKRVRPTITPDDPDVVEQILTQHAPLD